MHYHVVDCSNEKVENLKLFDFKTLAELFIHI